MGQQVFDDKIEEVFGAGIGSVDFAKYYFRPQLLLGISRKRMNESAHLFEIGEVVSIQCNSIVVEDGLDMVVLAYLRLQVGDMTLWIHCKDSIAGFRMLECPRIDAC